jgi:predicted unusual protein kinase regulating ubiquinone biosynthesis (AarF/ABC1/UbiB family)
VTEQTASANGASQRAQGARRYAATLGLAAKFTLQLWWLGRTRRLFSADRQAGRRRALYRRQAREFREFATRMGGLVIKVGQFLSVRVDMLPGEYIDELGKLQDAVPPAPAEQIAAVVETELGRPLEEAFLDFEPAPIAAASLGQVHRATLPDGRPVAVKVLRPGIEHLVETDLRSLRSVMSLLARFTKLLDLIDWEAVCRDFEDTHRDELDYLKEGRNAEAFQRNLLFNPHVEIPEIHWSHTTARVLTMEYMDGVKIDALEALDAAGVDRSQLARNLMEIYLHMLLNDGFFHADPHPGNILVRPDGLIQLIDFGMVGDVPEAMRLQFAGLVGAFFRRDAGGVVDALQALKFVGADADTAALKASLIPLIDSLIDNLVALFRGSSFLEGAMEGGASPAAGLPDASLDQLRELILTQPVSLPGQVSFLGKALITVFSNCFRLDPAVDLVDITREWIRPLGADAAREAVSGALAEALDLLRSLPATARHLVSLAQKMDDGVLRVGLTPAQFRELQQASRAQTRGVVRAVAAAAGALGALMVWLSRRR